MSKFSHPLNFFPLQNFTLSTHEQERDFIFSTEIEGKTSALETTIGCWLLGERNRHNSFPLMKRFCNTTDKSLAYYFLNFRLFFPGAMFSSPSRSYYGFMFGGSLLNILDLGLGERIRHEHLLLNNLYHFYTLCSTKAVEKRHYWVIFIEIQ